VDFRANLDAVARRKNSLPCRESNPDRPARSLITILNKLSRPHTKTMRVIDNIFNPSHAKEANCGQ